MNYKQIESLATDILKLHNLFKTPIDVIKLANKIGLKIIYHKMTDDISGMLMIKDGNGIIGVNKSHPKVRKRFTIAHEIGHYSLKHHREGSIFVNQKQHTSANIYRDKNSMKGEIWQEIEANAFAASLLMPKQIILKEIQNLTIDLLGDSETNEEAIILLAKKFTVSKQSMVIRLSNLNVFNPL